MNVKKQKTDHHESLFCQGDGLNPAMDYAATATSSQLCEDVEIPREIQGGGAHSVVVISPYRTMDAELSEVEEFKLPPLRLPEVFDFSNLSFVDRFDDLVEILANRKPCETEQAFADHVDAAVERVIGMDCIRTMACVWRSSDLACDVLVQMREVTWNSFPVVVRVELMEPFCFQICPNGSAITQDLVQSYLKNHNHKVDMMEIFPVYEDSGGLDEVALAIEQMRFFFNYIWRLSDSNDMGDYSFARRHLEPRLKLYYDVLNKKVSTGFCQKYQDTMTEYQAKCRQLRYQQACLDSDEDSVQGSDTSMDEIDGDKLDSDKLDGDKLDGDKLDGDKLDGDKLDGDKLDGDKLDGDKLDGDKLPGDKLPGDKLPGDKLPGDKLPGDKLPGDHDNGKGESNRVNKDQDREMVKKRDTDIEASDQSGDKWCTSKVKDKCSDIKDINQNDNDKSCSNIKVANWTTDNNKDQNQDKIGQGRRDRLKDKSKSMIDELGVLEMAHLWKDIEILEDSLEVMENPVMRYLMAIPPSNRRRRPSTALQLKQTRHHNKPVTHLVAEILTVAMLQSLQLPADTVLETHITATSALKSCYDNDTVLIFPGTYTGEGFGVIHQSVTIQGVGHGQDVVITCGQSEVTSLVGCHADHINITNLTFMDESDCRHSNGLLYVGLGTTSLTNCRFSCQSSGIIAGFGHLKMDSCEVFGAQSAGVTALQGSRLSLKSSNIHHCGKATPSALPQDTCGILVDLEQIPESNVNSDSPAKVITDSRIHDNAGCGLLVRIFGSTQQHEASCVDLDDLCTLAGSDLQVTNSDFSANAKGMAMLQWNCEGKLDLN